jgi:hypothetical protein
MAGKRVASRSPHVYVVGEEEEPRGPVKIGLTAGPYSSTGRGGMSEGNWRTLVVLHREPVPYEELRWREWLIHQHLRPWHRKGEWFDARKLMKPYTGWGDFLAAAFAGTVAGSSRLQLGDDEHHPVCLRRLTRDKLSIQFDATCSCGVVTVGLPRQGFITVLRKYGSEHLGYARSDPRLKALRGLNPRRSVRDADEELPGLFE